MKTLLAGLLIVMSSTASVAAPVANAHSEDWCADSVDFAMRTAQRRDEGTRQHSLAIEIHTHLLVFQQQYPALAESDMQHLVDAVYQRRWSRFKAAVGASKVCGVVQPAGAPGDVPPSASESLQ